jgi:hypothetical protein
MELGHGWYSWFAVIGGMRLWFAGLWVTMARPLRPAVVSPRAARCLPAKLFNILVDAVVWEWIGQLRQGGKFKEEKLSEFMAMFFASFLR